MPVPAGEDPLERDLLQDRAYAAIRDAIVDGTLAPGERLRDQELCAWLGLSRTPVREALARLEQDGLVETAPQRFTRVALLDRRAASDAFPVVAAVHALAAELAVRGSPTPTSRRCAPPTTRFAAALQADRRRRRAGRRRRLPRVFVTVCANAELPRVLDRLMPRVRRLERMRFGSLAGRDSVGQHEEIITRRRHRRRSARTAAASA